VSGSSSGAERPRFHLLPALLALAHAGWIWWLSSAPRTWGGGSELWSFLGNSFHFVLFGALAILLAETFRRDGSWTQESRLAVLLLATGYGIVDELQQSTIPGRDASAADVCVDFLGIVAALALWWGVRGPGRVRSAVMRALALGITMVAFNALRTWGRHLGVDGPR
jgi:VanZ family protein